MNSWRKQGKACLISLVLSFALAACDGEPEQKSDSAAPQDSITENQTTTGQPTHDPAEENPPMDNQEAAQQDAPEASSGTTAPEPDIIEGTTGEEPAAGGESVPPDWSPEPAPEGALDAGISPQQPVPAPPVIEASPSPVQPQTTPAIKGAVPPRKPQKPATAKVEKPARPPARKPGVIPANIPAARSGGSIQQAVAIAPAERLPSDPSVVPMEARLTTQPDLSRMQFKIQEIHFNPGSADLTPGGERKTLTASRFIADLQVRSVKVIGYADTVGPTTLNQELALARAGSVANLLRRAGVPEDLIETVGMGEARMPMPTTDDVSEPLNRCVGILVSVNEVH
jgi:outer membrane protein OmpA-like peptidoglycan-associated protein